MEEIKTKSKWRGSLADIVFGTIVSLGTSASAYVIVNDIMQLETFSREGVYCIIQDPRLIMTTSTTALTGIGWNLYRKKINSK
jgi:hypothetical protein